MSSQLCRPFWECTGLIDRNHSKVKWKIYKVNSSKAFSFSSAYKLGNKWVTLTTLNSNLVTFCNRFFASLVQKLHPLFYNTLMLYAIAHLSWNPTSETRDICDNFFMNTKVVDLQKFDKFDLHMKIVILKCLPSLHRKMNTFEHKLNAPYLAIIKFFNFLTCHYHFG